MAFRPSANSLNKKIVKTGRYLMKKIVALAATAVIALGFAAGEAAAAGKKVRVGTEGAYPPFNYFDTNKNLVGFDVEIAKALCEKAGFECTFVAQDWDGIIPALLAKKYDAIIASMSITEERKKRVDFTDKYYNTPARFIAPKGANLDTTPAGMKGKTIGAQRSTIHSNYLEDNYKGSNLKLYATQDEANMDLANGRLDAVLADSIVLLEWLEKTKEGACCAFVGPSYNDPKWFGMGAGIAVRKGEDDLREAFSKAIKEIRADGTYKKINDKYFPFDVY
jgi:polar amino acid transport system substrate-binding protein